MKNIPIFDLTAQYHNLKKEIDSVIKRIIETSAYISGQENAQFDLEFARYLGVKHCISVASGSSALDLALEALGVSTGDEVICPSHTFAATAEAIVHRGATPVFVDIDEPTYNLDPSLIEARITKRTKVIIPVHLYGQTAVMAPIMQLAKKYKLKVLEDAAQAHGAEYKGKKAGSIGDIAIFSFFPAKNLGCYGDGGAIVTNNAKLARQISLLKDHGRISKYEHQIIGYGERLDNLQAAVLLVKLKHLNRWNKRRLAIAKQYHQAFKSMFTIPIVHPDCLSVFYVYTLRHPQRDRMRKLLLKKGIETGIYYPQPLHLQQSFKYLGYQKGDLPVSERVAKEIFSIPVYPELSAQQVQTIISSVIESYDEISQK